MIKLLFKLFKKQFLKFAFSHQSKPVNFDRLEYIFIDSNGFRYYKFTKDDDIPILRKGRLEQYLKELQLGLSSDNLESILSYMEKALDGGNKPSIAKIGHAIEEIRNRRQILLHPEIMFNMVASLYIREDENPARVDEEIHEDKVNQFKKDSAGGLYDFFYSAGLNAYIPYLEKLKDGWTEFYKEQYAKIEAFQKTFNISSV